MNIIKLTSQFEKKLKRELKPVMGTPVALSGGVDSGVLAVLAKPRFVISVDLPGGEKYGEIKFARKIARYLEIKHIIVQPNPREFDKVMKECVKAIGRPIPHFNTFALYYMYKKLFEMGETEVLLGDGPDETMCGYTRNMIMNYLYKVFEIEAFLPYFDTSKKLLPNWELAYSKLINKDLDEVSDIFASVYDLKGSLLKCMNKADMLLMRPDMDDMSNGIAKMFGIKNIRPYQDNPKFDEWQFNLPDEAKIHNIEYGKYILRRVASKYLPEEIAWRKHKMGGPIYPVNKLKGWDRYDGEFGKDNYLTYQEKILHGK